MACGQIKTMTAQAIFLPVSCFLYRLGEPKPTEKWSTYMKISEGSLSELKKRFIEGYGGFHDKARQCGIEKIDFSIGVKHKKPDPPDFPSGRLFTVSSEDEWEIYRGFMLGENAKDYELVGEFSRLIMVNLLDRSVIFCEYYLIQITSNPG